MAAFPCLGYTFLYMFTASAYCLAILLAVLSVWLAQKGGWPRSLAACLLLALSMGIYQAYAAVAVSLSVLAVLRACLDHRANWKGTLLLGLRLMGVLAGRGPPCTTACSSCFSPSRGWSCSAIWA